MIKKITFIFLALVFIASTSSFLQAESVEKNPKKGSKVTPVLKIDPKVTAILRALGDNSSAYLPPIKTVGDWNETSKRYKMEKTGPVGRDFSIKAVWAPERKRALFCGGNHGTPHRLNDVWEYDLPSNTWVMLFAPDPNKPKKKWEGWVKKVVTLKDGVMMSKRGGPLHPSHTWWQLAYHPEMKAMIWAAKASTKNYQDILGLSAEEKSKLFKGPPFWLFYPEEKKWKLLKTSLKTKISNAQALEYIPELGLVFYSSNWFSSGMWVYSPKVKSWRKLKPNGSNPYQIKTAPRSEAVMAYDTENKVLVAVLHSETFHYDLAKNTWSMVIAEPKGSEKVPHGHDSWTPIGYDSVGKVIVLYDSKTPEHIWTHSVKDKKWIKNKVKGPPGPKKKLIGYWDPARNVMVVNSKAKVWVYRYKRNSKK